MGAESRMAAHLVLVMWVTETTDFYFCIDRKHADFMTVLISLH